MTLYVCIYMPWTFNSTSLALFPSFSYSIRAIFFFSFYTYLHWGLIWIKKSNSCLSKVFKPIFGLLIKSDYWSCWVHRLLPNWHFVESVSVKRVKSFSNGCKIRGRYVMQIGMNWISTILTSSTKKQNKTSFRMKEPKIPLHLAALFRSQWAHCI